MSQIKVKAQLSELDNLTAFIEEKITSSQKLCSELCVITDELFSNIVNYSKADYVSVEMTNVLFEGLNAVSVVFKDNGEAFNPLLAKDPDVTLSAQDRPIGGLGIYLVKKMSNEISYTRIDSENILTVIKTV